MNITYKFRLYPTKDQEHKLEQTLDTCRHLYNTALADRKAAYKIGGVSRSYEDQAAMLVSEKKKGNFNNVFSQVLQDVLRRLDKSFKAFFRRVKAGEKPGYPRFKGEGWYKSFTYPQKGFKIEGSKLNLSKIGTIRMFKHREVEGKIKTCAIKKDLLGHWYAFVVACIEDIQSVDPEVAIGVDVGLKSLITTSAGESIQYPRYYIMLEEKLVAAQRSLSRKKKGSANRRKAKAKVAKINNRIQNLRDEFHHQVSRKLVDSADIIVFENLNINGMLKNHHLAKHIQDHAWGKLIRFTQSKAAKAGKAVELVDARYTSQKCSQCGIMVPKMLAERTHACPNCGLTIDRDLNASRNIRTLGLRGRAYRDSTHTLSHGSRQARSMT